MNMMECKENLKLSLYSLEKSVTSYDEIIGWLEENKDVDVAVVTV
jgi:hypothetical protein